MSEPVPEATTRPKQHPPLAKIAAALAAVCDAGLLIAALARIGPLLSLCVLLLMLAGLLGVIALFLRGRKSLAVYASLNVLVLVPVLMLLAIPNMLNLKREANETSAILALRAIQEAEMQYNATYPANGFACSLLVLGGNTSPGPPSAQSAQLLPADLVSGQHDGYSFEITNCARAAVKSQEVFTSYEVTAVPEAAGKSGTNGYCLDMNGAIKKDPAGGTNCTVPVP
jgi:type IV pilus assembly protein PilA